MPLEILAPMVVIGILGIALMLHLTGQSRTDPLTAERAERAWAAQVPWTTAHRITLNDDARVALVETDRGPGLLWVFGADCTARLFTTPPTVREDADQITVTTGDFTANSQPQPSPLKPLSQQPNQQPCRPLQCRQWRPN